MRNLALAITLWALSSALARADATFPDLLFRANSGFGGFGRLVYSEATKRYQLLDGRLNTYVVDGQQIRLMRPDEGGGTMANPASIVALDGKIFGNSAYGQIHELDAVTGALGDKFSHAPFNYGGSGSSAALFASKKSLLVLDGLKLIALDSRLKKLGEKTLGEQQRHVRLSPDFIQLGDTLHDVVIDNPNTYTDCAGGCQLPTVIRHTSIDFSDPAALKVTSHEETIKEQQHITHKAVDGTRNGWFLVKTSFGKTPPVLAFHPFASLSKPTAELTLPEGATIAAVTKSTPLWIVLEQKKDGGGPRLGRVDWKGEKLELSTIALEWLKGSSHSFAIGTDEAGRLYLAANHQLAVYETSAVPRLLLQQDFVNANGASQLQLDSLLAVFLPKTAVTADRSRLERILAKDYWNDADHLAIQAELEKLKPADTWAIPLFTELLKKRQQSYNGGLGYAAKALGQFGAAAVAAVPALIYSTMEGSAIRGDALPVVKSAVVKIDPQGTATRAMLPECIKKTYVCEHVGKEILSGTQSR